MSDSMFDAQLSDLIAKAETGGIEPFDLDEDVTNVLVAISSGVNNEGLEAQLRLLLQNLSYEEVASLLRNLTKAKQPWVERLLDVMDEAYMNGEGQLAKDLAPGDRHDPLADFLVFSLRRSLGGTNEAGPALDMAKTVLSSAVTVLNQMYTFLCNYQISQEEEKKGE